MTHKRLSVLITGATGNLGQKLRRHLAAAGDYDLRLVCLNSANDSTVTTADLSRTDGTWGHLFDGVDTVLHFAGEAKFWADWTSIQRHNIDVTLNVFEAAAHSGVSRLVFASSNWAMAGYRFGTERLTTELPPRPVGFYGASKVVGERIGKSFTTQHGLSVICLRIGYCPAGDARDALMKCSRWGQEMWISDRDLCQLVERAILAKDIGFAIVNGMSNNPGMRWDLEEGRRLLGYAPADGHAVVLTHKARARELIARLAYGVRRSWS